MQNSESSLQGQRLNRIEKLEKLRAMGINPFPASSVKDFTNKEIVESYDKHEGKKVTLTGRLMTWREHGHIIFGNLQDDSGKIQLYIKDDVMPAKTVGNVLGWEDFGLLDMGDILQVSGEVTKTNTGEISILVDGIVLLTKSIRPLPEKWHGIQDKEERYRRRYLDMTMDPAIRERFKRRSTFWKAARDFMDQNGFYEVNIPVLEHVTGGADARPFVTHFDALDTDFFLRISHELPLKRLLGAGFEKVYDLGPRFRNEGFSDEHLPEHVAMEFYWAYADRDMGMKFMEELYKTIAKKVYGKSTFKIRNHEVDLDKKWEVLDYSTEMKNRFGIDIFNDSVESLCEVLKKEGGEVPEKPNRSRVVDTLWKIHRESIGGPAFVINIPKFFSPLAKADDTNPLVTQRVQPMIGGSEMASSWAELNDPIDQLDRFVAQQKMREDGDDEAQMMDIDFVEMLEYGMPPAFGFGMSERVFWFFEDVTAREGVPFPPMRWELDNTTKKVYADILKYIDPHSSGEGKKKEQDFTKKFVIVLDENTQGWKMTNTIGHISAYLGNSAKDDFASTDLFNLEKGNLTANSQYPLVTLVGKQAQLHALLDEVRKAKLQYNCYTLDMLEIADDIKLQKALENKTEDDLNILGIGIFGKKDVLEKLTKKYSLFK